MHHGGYLKKEKRLISISKSDIKRADEAFIMSLKYDLDISLKEAYNISREVYPVLVQSMTTVYGKGEFK